MTDEASTTTWETLVEQYRERAARDDARIEELMQRANHWHDTAEMLMRQRNMAEELWGSWKERALKAEARRRDIDDEAFAYAELVETLKAECEAVRKDAARLDWMADTVVVEAFGIDDVDAASGCAGMDIYEHASIVADERGNDDDPTVSDQREGFRRMIDAAMGVQP